jgi:hypothetical protein
MKIKSILLLFFITTTISVLSQTYPVFNYIKAAQVYWKYRYRLVGDYITPDSITRST